MTPRSSGNSPGAGPHPPPKRGVASSRDPVVEPSALDDWPDLRWVDASACALIWETAARTGETGFDNLGFWQDAIGALGLDAVSPTIVFDDGRLTDAARVWFILQYFGVRAFILNGGRPALAGEPSPLPAPTARFRARPGAGPVGLIDRDGLKARIGGGAAILDARTAGEYRGQDLRGNPRGGHLPGARWLPHASLMDGPRLRPTAELRDLFSQAGFRSGDPIVTHCDGGGRAALAAAAAVRAGHAEVRVYYLSFADWARGDSCPIVQDRP
ncbi:thiosulfate/3-mercaptopyruvate sulfurtransferase [Caulobacter ginsengisoli]|uniref:Thiosulfate/3-mercaptopyruvate sulfurtransferase n=1 Tax=Caulobacter ginsengisoli TaxID=400775 RepID=A0ABU0IQQ2_9CAUL|nr:rhodanese-like domain-containing protein [Caulobacter ginsengisoli]MDQ0464343.1 thiosulfate/3-mercaptopyruvate sulfurtransferase [Caulobacter ginsengisoli]